MWTETTQPRYRRDGLRHASDVTDEEWAQIEALLAMPKPKPLGRPRTTPMRQVVNAPLYVLTTGCQGRLLPKELPPFSTVQRFFYRWRDAGLWPTINHALVMRGREAAGREASPSAGVIDSQSVKTTETAGPRVEPVLGPAEGPDPGDAGKKIKGRKRHVLTDANALLVAAVVDEADVQDRDGAPLVLATARDLYPWLRHVFADGGYRGVKRNAALDKLGRWTVAIVKRSDTATGFVALPRAGWSSPPYAWLNRNRRLAKDFEATLESALAWLFLASVKLLMRLGRIPQPQILI
jgi:transposase